ncbi:hypothetical protein ES705_24805 [subsurface metagenome]
MAKANAPLFSLKASGKLGDALVYFNWKGINCVRSYVIPSNPRSTAQLAQRDHMINAVLNWHLTSHSALDRQAWANWATAIVATLTGFNAFCKHYIKVAILGKSWANFHDYENTAKTTTTITSDLASNANVTDVRCWYGLSPTSMINQVACTGTYEAWEAAIEGLAINTKYYLQFEAVAPDNLATGKSGIYTETTS